MNNFLGQIIEKYKFWLVVEEASIMPFNKKFKTKVAAKDVAVKLTEKLKRRHFVLEVIGVVDTFNSPIEFFHEKSQKRKPKSISGSMKDF